jgi:hypothetical protein
LREVQDWLFYCDDTTPTLIPYKFHDSEFAMEEIAKYYFIEDYYINYENK